MWIISYRVYVIYMKILFIDIDGVLALSGTPKQFIPNTYPKAFYFDKVAVDSLNKIISKTDCELVVTSDWRIRYDLLSLKVIFNLNCVCKQPIDATSILNATSYDNLGKYRILEISDWIRTNNPVKWCVIDDMDLSEIGNNFVLCEDYMYKGISDINVINRAIELLT